MGRKFLDQERGYTIIETMIAISIFIVVVMAGMTALLNANLVYEKTQDTRTIIDSLSFVMEDMARNIKTGYDYHCVDDTPEGTLDGVDRYSCEYGKGISFMESSGLERWVYYIHADNSIHKKIIGGDEYQLTPPEIVIKTASSFSVLGAESPEGGDRQQPFVTIRLVGEIYYKGTPTPFSLQTSASHRLIDI